MKYNSFPKRRFKGFTNAWEQRKLGELIIRRNEFDPNIKLSIDVNLENLVSDTGQLVGDLSHRTKTKSMFLKGDVLFGRLRPYLNKWWLADCHGRKSGEIWALYPVNSNDNKFIYSLVQTGKFLTAANISSGTKMPRADWNKVANTRVMVPEFEEQKYIGNLIFEFDNLITLHQRKLDKWKATKNGLLQKMFPQNGQSQPELRLPGFSGAWEQRKFRDIFSKVESGNRLPKTMLWTGEVPYVLAKITDNGIHMYIDKNSLDYHGNEMKLFPANSITFSIDNPDAIFYQHTAFFTSNIMRVLHEKELNKNHYIFILESLKFLTKSYNWSFKFSGPVVMNSPIFLPFSREKERIDWHEINSIGELIASLDNLITLHQRKLEKLKNLKQAYLNEMFV